MATKTVVRYAPLLYRALNVAEPGVDWLAPDARALVGRVVRIRKVAMKKPDDARFRGVLMPSPSFDNFYRCAEVCR